MPELVAALPAQARRASSARRLNAIQADAQENTMQADRPDPNAELHTREPLRIIFALVALLLGLIAALHA